MATTPIVALEIGTHRVGVAVGEPREDQHLAVIGVGYHPSVGVRKGEIVHFEHALECVRSALHMAEEKSDVTINEVCLLISGRGIESSVQRGITTIMRPDHEITTDDVAQVRKAVRNVKLDEGRQLLHTVDQHYYVNDRAGVIDPVGLEGSELMLTALVIHGPESVVRDTVKVARTADMAIEDMAYAGLCSALAVCSPEQKESGVICMDLGAGTTDTVVYMSKCLAYAGSVGVGGDHVTNDIRLGLRLSQAQAENVKVEHGSALVQFQQRDRVVSVPPTSDLSSAKNVRLFNLQTIINARMEELFGIIKQELEDRNLLHHIGGGIVLTGGGARLRGVTELAEKIFNLPCEIGRPYNISGLGVSMDAPELAAVLGMLRYRTIIEPNRGSVMSPVRKMLRKITGI